VELRGRDQQHDQVVGNSTSARGKGRAVLWTLKGGT
jgi:hypothetical protein